MKTQWISVVGVAFDRNVWHNIVKKANEFCTYDDYNWDWSLQFISQQHLRNELHPMIMKGPRVFHIGEL